MNRNKLQLSVGISPVKKIALVISILGIGTATAFAADLAPRPYTKAPPPPPVAAYNWTGFYIGASGGYGWNQGSNVALSSVPVTPAGADVGLAIGAANAIPTALSTQPKGFLAGGEIGYNYQWQQWVLGVEADFSGANISGSANANAVAPVPFQIFTFSANGSAASEQKLDFFGTLRARLGYTVTDRFLIYGTGGLAYAHAESNTTTGDLPINVIIGPAAGAATGMLAGWTAGAGFEWAFAPSWSFKTEYLYYDLGSLNYALSPNAVSTCCTVQEGFVNTTASATFRGNIVRVGINYKFSGAP
jgi:outer membrane immunogenic protein